MAVELVDRDTCIHGLKYGCGIGGQRYMYSWTKIWMISGGSRNLERGVQSPARKARRKIFWVATPTFGHVNAFIQNIAGRPNHRLYSSYVRAMAEPRGPSLKKSRTLSDSVVLVNYNFN